MAFSLRRAASAIGFALLSTCAGIDNFEVEAGGRARVPARSALDVLLGQLGFAGFDSIDLSQEFENQGVRKEDVDSVRLVALELRVTSPEGATFDFLDSASFFVEAEGLPRVRIGALASVPAGASALSLEVDEGVELRPYVVAPSMTISSEVSGERPAEETIVEATATLDVDVTTGCE